MAEADFITREQFNTKFDPVLKHITDLEIESKKFHKTLYGNGEPGWDEILRMLLDDLKKRQEAEREAAKEAKDDAREKKKDWREEWQKYLYFGVTLIVGGTIGGIIDVLINQRFGH